MPTTSRAFCSSLGCVFIKKLVVCRHELLRGGPYAHVDVVGLSALFGLIFRSRDIQL